MIQCNFPIAPISLQEPGLSSTNRVGVAPDVLGTPMLCYSGAQKQLNLLSGVPGARRWYEWDCLALPVNRTNVLLIETIGKIEEATDEYVELRNEILAPPCQYKHLYPETPSGEPPPFPHQVEAFCWAHEAFKNHFHGFGQFSEQGTGKTRWACDMLRFHCHRTAVVIVQNSIILQWKDWLQRICPDFEIRMLTGCSIKQRTALIEQIVQQQRLSENPVIFVANWEVIYRLQDSFVRLRPDLVIADEATRAKERNAKMSKALHRIGAAANLRIAMTGTPIGNNPGDLWSIYRFLEPSLFDKSYWTYMQRYFFLGGISGYDFLSFNPAQIAPFISKLYASAFRVTKSTLADMPEKNYETVHLKMSREQRHLYDQVQKDFYARLVREDGTESSLSVPNALVQVTRLQQICAGLFPTDPDDGQTVASVPIASAKTEWLSEYCREAITNTDAQMVIWCRFTNEIRGICKALGNAGLNQGDDFAFIDGSVSTKIRREHQIRFNDREDSLRILVAQIQAIALGFDLPQADEMIYHTNSYSYLDRAQSLERGHRMGRTRPYKIIDLVCENSIDVKVLAALNKKASLADLVLTAGIKSVLD